MNNIQYYEARVEKFKEEGCKLPEAAALAKLVELHIRNKTFCVYDYSGDVPYKDYDVIVVFNFAGDPTFGVFNLDDGEPAMLFSTATGLMKKYL